jgi:hypothetical protein
MRALMTAAVLVLWVLLGSWVFWLCEKDRQAADLQLYRSTLAVFQTQVPFLFFILYPLIIMCGELYEIPYDEVLSAA